MNEHMFFFHKNNIYEINIQLTILLKKSIIRHMFCLKISPKQVL